MARRGDHELLRRTSELVDANRTVRSRDVSRPMSSSSVWSGCDETPVSITIGDVYVEQDLEASAPVGVYYIYGNIIDGSDDAVSGVLVIVEGNGVFVNSDTTDEAGDYIIWFICDGEYTVTPTKVGYEFTPVDVTVDGVEKEQDFVGIASYVLMNRRTVTIDHTKIGSDLTDFGVYVYISDLDKAHLRSDGQDIAFFLPNGTRLPLEIELYIDTGETGVLHAWVKVPTVLAAQDTILHMYYNDSGYVQPDRDAEFGSENVWDSYYIGVWHMYYDPDETHIKDSTSHERVGTLMSGAFSEVDGVIGKQIYNTNHFPGNNIEIPHHATLMSSEKTISFWAKTVYANNECISKDPYTDPSFEAVFYNSAPRFEGTDENGKAVDFRTATVLGSTSRYVQLVYGYNGGGAIHKIYIDKNDEDLISESTEDNGHLRLTDAGGDLLFMPRNKGYYDEIRISSVKRSKVQHDAEHDNQSSPGTFLTIGAETDDSKGVS